MTQERFAFTTDKDVTPGEHIDDLPAVVATHEGTSIINLLILLLSGKHVDENDIVRVLNSKDESVTKEQFFEESKALVAEPNRQRLVKTLFQSVRKETIPFTEVLKEPGKIIYADPFFPDDVTKRITYLWNAEVGKWQVIPGKNADAIIANENDVQLLEVKAGKTNVYGNQNGSFVVQSIESQAEQKDKQLAAKRPDVYSLLAGTQKAMLSGMEDAVRFQGGGEGNILSVFQVNPNKKEKLLELAKQFSIQQCDRTRNQLMVQMSGIFRGDLLNFISLASPYEEGGFKYFWYEVGDKPLGVRVDAEQNIQIILPEGYRGQEVGLMLLKDWIEGTTKDGKPHPKTGFSGGSLILIDASGRATLYNSAKNPNSAHLVPGKPAITGTISLALEDIEAHIVKAREAARVNSGQHSRKPRSSDGSLERQEEVKLPKKRMDARSLSRVVSDIPQVKTPSGLNYTLHCAFDEENCQYEHDADYYTYPAKVYVFTYPGTGIKQIGDNFKIPQGIIVEVSKDGQLLKNGEYAGNIVAGEARIRAAYDQGKSTNHHANIIFRGKTASVKNIGADYENVSITFPLTDDSYFRDNGSKGRFMCANGCSSNYSSENRAKMKTGEKSGIALSGRI